MADKNLANKITVLPCPFCGSGAVHLLVNSEESAHVFCESCDASGPTAAVDGSATTVEFAAVAMWNNRAHNNAAYRSADCGDLNISYGK